MLTDKELLELLNRENEESDRMESDRVEFAESGKDKDKICEAICAFANDSPGHGLPGVVFVGMDNKGNPTGRLTVDDELLRRLGELRDNGNILPLPSMAVQKRKLAGAEVAVVIVEPAIDPPVRYKGRCWIRVGPRRALAGPSDEVKLNEKRVAAALTFDQQPARPPAGLGDLNPYAFQEYLSAAVSADTLAENNRDMPHQLQSLGFMNIAGNINNAGILCFGKKPANWLGGAYIQFLRCPGTDIVSAAEAVDHKEIRGTIFQQIRDIESLMKVHIQTPAIIGSPRRVDFPAYPAVALEQAIRNAVLHRSYEGTNAPVQCYWFSDRVEISSPGGPYGRVTVNNFEHGGLTDYRNRKLAEAMREMEFIERFGFGIRAIRRSMERNGNPEPEFRVGETNVTVILRKLDLDSRDGLVAKAAELACCQGLFRFKRDWDSKFSGNASLWEVSQRVLIYMPGVSRLGDNPGFPGWAGYAHLFAPQILAHNENMPAEELVKKVALKFAGECTRRRKIGEPMVGKDAGKYAPLPTTSLVRMARIMYILRELFGAEDEEIRECLKHSLFPYPWNASETRTRDEEDAEFRRLVESRPSLAEMESDINREAADERIQALLVHE